MPSPRAAAAAAAPPRLGCARRQRLVDCALVVVLGGCRRGVVRLRALNTPTPPQLRSTRLLPGREGGAQVREGGRWAAAAVRGRHNPPPAQREPCRRATMMMEVHHDGRQAPVANPAAPLARLCQAVAAIRRVARGVGAGAGWGGWWSWGWGVGARRWRRRPGRRSRAGSCVIMHCACGSVSDWSCWWFYVFLWSLLGVWEGSPSEKGGHWVLLGAPSAPLCRW